MDNVAYLVHTETAKGKSKVVKTVEERKIGIIEFRQLASKKMDMVTVAKVYVTRQVNGEDDGNGKLLRLIRKEEHGEHTDIVVVSKHFRKLDIAS